MPGALDGKTAFTTAAAQGIGRATALAFAAAGATVIATDVNEAKLADLASDRIRVEKLDATDRHAIRAAAERHGPVDILFNCAGFVHQGTILEATDDEWDFAFNLNARSMFHTMQAFLPGMLEKGAARSSTSPRSSSTLKGVPNRFIYTATKSAVIGMTSSVAADFVARGIRCNCICPGTVAVAEPGRAHRGQRRRRRLGRGGARGFRRAPADGAARHAGGDREARRLSRERRGGIHDRPSRRHRRRSHSMTPVVIDGGLTV